MSVTKTLPLSWALQAAPVRALSLSWSLGQRVTRSLAIEYSLDPLKLQDVALTRSGLILDEDFKSGIHPIFRFSPLVPSRFPISTNLQILHGTYPAWVYAPLPVEDGVVLEARLLHQPANPYDRALVSVFSEDGNRLDVVQDETQTGSQFWVRLLKSGTRYEAWGWEEEDPGWQLLGAYDLPRAYAWGVGLSGVSGNPLTVEHLRMYRGSLITVTGLAAGWQVTLEDGAGQVIHSQVVPESGETALDLMADSFPLSARVVIRNDAGELLSATALREIWGGDIFAYFPTVAVYYNHLLLGPSFPIRLPDLLEGQSMARLQLRNIGETLLQNVKLGIAPEYPHMDLDWITLAPDVNGAPSEPSQTLTVAELPPQTDWSFWVVINRPAGLPEGLPLTQDYRFKLTVSW